MDRVRDHIQSAWSRMSARQRFSDDGGAVIVEAALILPLLVMIMAGTFDFGVGFRNRITMQGAVRNAARSAAVLGPDVTADKFALSTLAAGLSGLNSSVLQRAVIFQTSNTGSISLNCSATLSPSPTGAGDISAGAKCNVYGLTQMQSLGSFVQAGAGCAVGWDKYWCPSTRNNLLTGPPDYLGVYLAVTYTPFTKMFKNSFTLTDKVVVRIEPQAG